MRQTPNLFQRLVAFLAAVSMVMVVILVPRIQVVEGTVLTATPARPTLAPLLDWRTTMPLLVVIALVAIALWVGLASIDDRPARSALARVLFGAEDAKGRRSGGLLSSKPVVYTLLVVAGTTLAINAEWVKDNAVLAILAMILIPSAGLAVAAQLRRHFVVADADPLAQKAPPN